MRRNTLFRRWSPGETILATQANLSQVTKSKLVSAGGQTVLNSQLVLCHVVFYHAFYIVSCCIVLCPVVLYRVLLYRLVLCCIVPCCIMSCCVVSSRVVSCFSPFFSRTVVWLSCCRFCSFIVSSPHKLHVRLQYLCASLLVFSQSSFFFSHFAVSYSSKQPYNEDRRWGSLVNE